MSDVSRRRTGELLRKLFSILLKNPDGLQAGKALSQLADAVTLTAHEAGEYEEGSRRFEKIVRFATVDCVKAGWLIKNKGTWSVTEAGASAYKKLTDPEEFAREASKLYRAWKRGQPDKPTSPSDLGLEEIEAAEQKSATITFEQAGEQAWNEVEQYLRNMNPMEFQHLVAGLLKAMGYHVSWVSPPGKDGGIDVIAHTDPLGTQQPRIKVQVKRVGHRVDSDGLKLFVVMVNEADVGLYVSTGGFTRDAEDFARNQERRRVTLIDLERLLDLWVEHLPRMDDTTRRRMPLTPIYFLTPED
ncbi:MAG: Mrr restriction system protein [Alphaproteobacteria bacterium]|nr:Mrr restriction system protein [Alphaproteobacteria bacterium]